jgi:hypothetical protein
MKHPTKDISVPILPQSPTFSQSQDIALKLATVAPSALFCAFNANKIPFKRSGQGVSKETPKEDLFNNEDVWAMESLPYGDYFGLVQQTPIQTQDGHLLVCLDVDMKRASTATNVAIQRMAKHVKAQNLLTEVSVSGKGRHVFITTKDDPRILPKYKLGGGQEVEVFGLSNSAGKSVLLSGNQMSGSLGEPVDLYELLLDWGIIEQHQLQEPKPQAPPSQSFDFTNITKGAPDEFNRATQALTYISPDCDYQQWIELGQALHTAFGEQGLAAWGSWSSSGAKYKGSKDIEIHWKSFHQGKGISLGTLFHMAKENGYQPPTKQTERKSAVEDFAAVIQKSGSPDEPAALSIDPSWPELTLDLSKLNPIDYLIEGFMAHSFFILAGQPGVGKTTAVLSMCMVMAGFSVDGCEIYAKKKRKSIIVTEDSDQIIRTLFAYSKHYKINNLNDWFVVIDARRSNVKDLLRLAHNIERHTVNDVKPLLVLDTANATMDIDNENDNSEVGAYIAAIKQTIFIQQKAPVCILTHTNKTISRQDSDAMARGASAFTGDATLTGVLFMDEDNQRYLKLTKTRYEPKFREIKFDSITFPEIVVTPAGDMQEIICRVAIPAMSSEQDRKQLVAERQSDKKQQQVLDTCDQACNYVQSIINQHQQVIMRRGPGRPIVPKELEGMHQLEWPTIYLAVPSANQSHSRRAVGAAIFQRFAQGHEGFGWVQLK